MLGGGMHLPVDPAWRMARISVEERARPQIESSSTTPIPREPKKPVPPVPAIWKVEVFERLPRCPVGLKTRTGWPSTYRTPPFVAPRFTVTPRRWNIESRRSGPGETKVGILVVVGVEDMP